MSDELQQMKCGNCGKRRVTLRARAVRGNSDRLSEIRARCCNCKSVTVFAIGAPVIVPEWGPGANGVLCVGWAKRAARGDQ